MKRIGLLLLSVSIVYVAPMLCIAQSMRVDYDGSVIDKNRVDLLTGVAIVPTQVMSIGVSGAGLSQTVTRINPDVRIEYVSHGLTWFRGSNFSEEIFTLNYLDLKKDFTKSTGDMWISTDGDGETFECSTDNFSNGSPCVYRRRNGDVAYYKVNKLGTNQYLPFVRTTIDVSMEKILKTDGEVVDINLSSGQDEWGNPELYSVVSSHGYMLKFTGTNSTNANYASISSVNLSYEYCSHLGTACVSNSYNRPILNISTAWHDLEYGDARFPDLAGNETLVTTTRAPIFFGDADAVDTHTIVTPGGRVKLVKYYTYELDGQSNPENTGPPHELGKVRYVQIGDLTTEYAYGQDPFIGPPTGYYTSSGQWVSTYNVCNYTPGDVTTQTYDAHGKYESAVSASLKSGCWFYPAKMKSFRDKLGNVTYYQYDEFARVKKKTLPDGAYEDYAYDARGNLVSRISHPKPGSNLAPIATESKFPDTCQNLKTCNKPEWVRDAKGNQTDYTYYATHGGLESETAPPNEQGVRLKTRYEYMPLFAKIRDSSGNLVNAAGAIYKLTKVSTCASARSACDLPEDTVTEYQYVHNNLLMTAKTVRAGDGSVSATVSYGYDYVGNTIWVDGPLSGDADKIYTAYNVFRQKTLEVGPDPDGNGPLKRQMVKRTYDLDHLETRTETGTCREVILVNTVPSGCSEYVWSTAKNMTYDAVGRLSKTEVVVP